MIWAINLFFFNRDASFGVSVYTITILDCLRAVNKAKRAGFFEFDDFDCEEYEHYERVQVCTPFPKFHPFLYKDFHLLFHEANTTDPLHVKKRL